MATRFQSIELKNPGIFGVQLSGTVSPGDKKLLIELVDKCLDKDKVHLILDFSQVKTMGGGGASVLAGFQQKLVAENGEAVFVGAGEIVRNFLEQKFDGLPLRHFTSVEEAEADLADKLPADPEQEADEPTDEELEILGAVGFSEDDPRSQKVDSLIEEFTGKPAPAGFVSATSSSASTAARWRSSTTFTASSTSTRSATRSRSSSFGRASGAP